MNRSVFLFCVLVLGLLLGFLAGQFLPVNRPPPLAPVETPDAPTTVDEIPSEEASVPPPSLIRGLDTNTPAANVAVAPSFDATNTPVAMAQAQLSSDDSVRIPRRFLSKIQCQVFHAASNCVTDDIVELLRIAPEERERLDRLIASTRARIESDELDRAVVTEQSPTRVVLKIAANPEAGRDIEKDYLAGVQATLGDRTAMFMDRARMYDSTFFSNFGRNDTLLTVTRDENSSLLRVQSRQEYTTPGGSGSSTSVTMSEQMPVRWKKFFQTP